MRIISSDEINQRLTEIWPSLEQIWCFDQSYMLPTFDHVESMLRGGLWVDTAKITAKNPDCDDFALQQHAIIKQHENLSFGEAFGDKFNGWSAVHMNNICMCEEGVFIINPGKRNIAKADATNDNPLWVRF